MKSPFPGMDPYLEAHWSAVHINLLVAIQDALQPLLPPLLRARAHEQVTPESAPDEPIIRFVKIIDIEQNGRLVTAIEVLSPWNKAPGPLNDEYSRRLGRYADAGVNVVEIDLLRCARGKLALDDARLPPETRTGYFVTIGPATEPGRWDVFPIPLRVSLPWISVPLRSKDVPVVLQLQPLIERVYAGGAYDDIDYSKQPKPPLRPDDEAWADELLRKAGRR